jgi:hypothetical protein
LVDPALFSVSQICNADEALAETDGFWAEVKAAVQTGDYDRYEATHPLRRPGFGAKDLVTALKALAGWASF